MVIDRVVAGGVDCENYEGVGVGDEVVWGEYVVGGVAESRPC